MDVHPTKNVSIGIDPYPGSQKSPRLNCFFAQPRIAGPSLSWRSRRRLERLFTWRPSNPRAPPSRMMFKKKTARKVACKSHTQKKTEKNIYLTSAAKSHRPSLGMIHTTDVLPQMGVDIVDQSPICHTCRHDFGRISHDKTDNVLDTTQKKS